MTGLSWTLWIVFLYIFSLLPYHIWASFPAPIKTWPLNQSGEHQTECYESITANHHPLLTYRPMHFDTCYGTMAVVSITDPLRSFTITLEVYPEIESGVIMHYRGNNILGIIVHLLKGILYVTVKQVIMAGGYIPANTWTSLAISYDSPSGTFYLHVNGYQLDSSAGHQLLIGVGILQLGNDVYEAGMGRFKGMMTSLYDVSVQSFDRYKLMHKEALIIACRQDIFTTMWPWQPSRKNIMDSIKTRDLPSTSDNIWLTTTGQPRQPPSSSSNTMVYILIGVLTAAVVGPGLVISHLILVCRRKKKTKKDKAGTSSEQEHRNDNTEDERMENIYVMS